MCTIPLCTLPFCAALDWTSVPALQSFGIPGPRVLMHSSLGGPKWLLRAWCRGYMFDSQSRPSKLLCSHQVSTSFSGDRVDCPSLITVTPRPGPRRLPSLLSFGYQQLALVRYHWAPTPRPGPGQATISRPPAVGFLSFFSFLLGSPQGPCAQGTLAIEPAAQEVPRYSGSFIRQGAPSTLQQTTRANERTSFASLSGPKQPVEIIAAANWSVLEPQRLVSDQNH